MRLITESIYKSCMGEDVLDLAFIDFHTHFLLENNCEFGNLTIESNGKRIFLSFIIYAPNFFEHKKKFF